MYFLNNFKGKEQIKQASIVKKHKKKYYLQKRKFGSFLFFLKKVDNGAILTEILERIFITHELYMFIKGIAQMCEQNLYVTLNVHYFLQF